MTRWQPGVLARLLNHTALMTVVLTTVNLLFNIIANAGFKASADSRTWRGFLFWQVLGNLAGFITVLTLTGLLRYLPLRIAFPLTTGLTVIGVQMAAAHWLFREPITLRQWMGTLLIAAGIFFVGTR